MCLWQQATGSLRLLLLGGSCDKTPNTGEILCCWVYQLKTLDRQWAHHSLSQI